MLVHLLAEGAFISLVCEGVIDRRRRFDARDVVDFSHRYGLLRERADPAGLLALGRDLHGWLDGPDHWLTALRSTLVPPFLLEIGAPLQPDASAWALLHAPWELLADHRGFLAQDVLLRFAPARRLGTARAAAALDGFRLGVAAMASAPRGSVELDYEAEEAAILSAARSDLDLLIEDSGDPEELGRRVADLGPGAPPILHLSCHGHNAWRTTPGAEPCPVLIMEDAKGDQVAVTAGTLIEALGSYRPRLLFLSACLTAATSHGAAEAVADSLSTALVRSGLPAVLGWDGSVADAAATAFAHAIYGALAKRQSIVEAAATARRALLGITGTGTGASRDAQDARDLQARLTAAGAASLRDWHLARVWLGPEGGGPVVGGPRKRSMLPPDHGHKQLLARKGDASLVVANPAMFVGRRRDLQATLKALSSGDHAGVLLHGMGRLGKSSLAARVAGRRRDLRLSIVYEDYDALSVLAALAEALNDHAPSRFLLRKAREAVRGDPAGLEGVLIDLLSGPCQQEGNGQPVLLLIDDLERVLETDPGGRHRVRAAEAPVLRAVLRAFDPARSDSRLLLTSRFRFSLIDGDDDLAERLHPVQLASFGSGARQKLSLRQLTAAQGRLDEAAIPERLPLLARAQDLARGNPGLQDVIADRLVLRPAVPVTRVIAMLDQMEAYLDQGALGDIETEEVRTVLQNLAVDALLDQAGRTGRDLLRAVGLFRVPVPAVVVDELAAALGGSPSHLRDLGLLEPFEDLVEPSVAALAVNGLMAGRLPGLSEAEAAAVARMSVSSLFQAWGGGDGRGRRPSASNIELTRLVALHRDYDSFGGCG